MFTLKANKNEGNSTPVNRCQSRYIRTVFEKLIIHMFYNATCIGVADGHSSDVAVTQPNIRRVIENTKILFWKKVRMYSEIGVLVFHRCFYEQQLQ